MNRTAIEWTDFTWNPVSGCWGPGGTAEKPKRCAYCYAEKVAKRFRSDRIKSAINFAAPFVPNADSFMPMFYPDRLSQPAKVKKPSRIFVSSMGDLFGDWVPENWINAVFQHADRCPQHTFQFLTKNPKRLKDFNPWPSNCWVGCTVTNQADADERIPWLLQVDAPVRFVSHEPLLGEIDLNKVQHPEPYFKVAGVTGILPEKNEPDDFIWGTKSSSLQWAIIGAQTGPGAVKPEPEWIQGLVDQYQAAGVPLFLKDNLLPFMRGGCQEFPA